MTVSWRRSTVGRAWAGAGGWGNFQDPKPHISIAWLLGDQRDRLEAALASLRSQVSFLDLLSNKHKHQVSSPRPHPSSVILSGCAFL